MGPTVYSPMGPTVYTPMGPTVYSPMGRTVDSPMGPTVYSPMVPTVDSPMGHTAWYSPWVCSKAHGPQHGRRRACGPVALAPGCQQPLAGTAMPPCISSRSHAAEPVCKCAHACAVCLHGCVCCMLAWMRVHVWDVCWDDEGVFVTTHVSVVAISACLFPSFSLCPTAIIRAKVPSVKLTHVRTPMHTSMHACMHCACAQARTRILSARVW